MKKINQEIVDVFYGHQCNYSCDNCISGSNFITNRDFDPDVEEIKKGISLMAEKFTVSRMITLLGGESMLYWNDRIIELAKHIRKCFPETVINVTTNGQVIHKHTDSIVSLMKELSPMTLSITRHLDSIRDKKVYQIWEKHVDQFLADKNITKIHNEHYHVKDNIHANIYLTPVVKDWMYYYKRQGNKIKPYTSNNYELSHQVTCGGHSVCSSLVGTRMYKCINLASLRNSLQKVGQLADPDWEMYTNYKPLDLANIDNAIFENFVRTYTKAIPECDMCNDNPSKNLKISDRDYKQIFSNEQIIVTDATS